MDLRQEIERSFANLQKGRASFIEEYNCVVFIFENELYGVAIPYFGKKINESFANVQFYSNQINFGDEEKKYLILASNKYHLRNEFSLICANFADQGSNNTKRSTLLKDPLDWWERWKELLGNTVRNKKTYSIIAEMLVVKYLHLKGEKVKWKPSDYATHDVETEKETYEIKSTSVKYKEEVTINSQFQLKDLDNLILCRYEKSNSGQSVEDLVEDLTNLGWDRTFLNKELNEVGITEGSSSRNHKYKTLEIRKYIVDDKFPGKELLNFLQSFNDPSIGKVSFDINLKGKEYKKIQ
ncbi:Putative PD-(D/E)XK family member [Marinococcus luteus]|uniref:Putative PD-(D/E)XK family member n=1 Tax=Marinococcus luteus TaxID=1122204 RepID=A0A1H2QGG4_9BACI|nr:PD-(D/E)XK motif protein [Marinococcus luteus]SDW06030.1 Putative PD-(D/E)XK family member [Marinococcus luteus]